MIDKIDIRKSGRPAHADSGKGKSAVEADDGIWAFLNKDIRLFGGGMPDKIKEGFYLELSTLLSAGVDIRASLDLVREEQTKKKHQRVFASILQQITAGSTLSSALRKEGLFTAYEYYSVQIGEETGKLVAVLGELAAFYKKKIDQRRQIIGALTYPVLVLVVAGMAVSFMLGYVVPMFSEVLKRFGGNLPFITRLVLRLSTALRHAGPLLLLALTGIVILVVSQRNKDWFRRWSSAILLRIPLIGDIVRKIYLSRFSGTMSLLIASRIPIIQSLQLVKKMIRFYPIGSSLAAVEEQVMSGMPLYKSLSLHDVYPSKMISLLKVGEEVNQLDIFFGKLAEQYSGEVEYRTGLLSKFLEPLIIVILGLVVGVILIAMYLPLFELGQAV
ncbi:MAG TPA: type II secretion system F family protein [Puia sp.]|jgi:type IV pilus assembly protein PilC|nr:type II secretion system F family protein [Puia sp.]